jgi:hypothetical protein
MLVLKTLQKVKHIGGKEVGKEGPVRRPFFRE